MPDDAPKPADPSVEPPGYKPPTSAEELLERYAKGERYFVGAQLRSANLKKADLRGANLSEGDLGNVTLAESDLRDANLQGAKLPTANLNGANLRQAILADVNLGGSELVHADITDADLCRAYLSGADLRWAFFAGADFDGATLSDIALHNGANLLAAKWDTLIISNQTYRRDAVERGEQTLPIGTSIPLSILIETARLRGEKRDAAETVADYLAANGIEARVESVGGAGTIIRISVREKRDAHILLQTGDGVCRLLGLGRGVENLLAPESGRRSLQTKMDEGFALIAKQANYSAEAVLEALDRIGPEDLKSVRLSGFTDVQMAGLRKLADLGSEHFQHELDERHKELLMTPGQKVARDVYEMKVAKPLRTLIAAAFRPMLERGEAVGEVKHAVKGQLLGGDDE